MKTVMWLLFSIIGLQLHAQGPMIFEDHDLGIEMQIPAELAKNWEITYTPTGAKLDIYHSNESKPDKFYVLVLGRMPVADLEFADIEDFSAIIAKQVNSVMGEDFFDDEDLVFDFSPIDRKMNVDIGNEGYRFRMTDLDIGITMPVDVHVFFTDQHALCLLTAVSPEMDEKKLTDFTDLLLRSVDLIDN